VATDSSTALITGGTSGIGRATANKLAQLGIHVVVVGRHVERGEKTVAEIRTAGGKADLFRLTFETRRAPAKWPEERSSSEAVMSIF
jgi:NAD(P)-dependent dehydrogenase (short-subunit alcohol dehydrogenase family)